MTTTEILEIVENQIKLAEDLQKKAPTDEIRKIIYIANRVKSELTYTEDENRRLGNNGNF